MSEAIDYTARELLRDGSQIEAMIMDKRMSFAMNRALLRLGQ